MKPAPFAYHRPGSIDAAIALLGTLENAKVISGGQSLVAMMNFRYAMPDHLIDVARIPELQGIVRSGSRLQIGAATRQCDLESSAPLAQTAPLFKAALLHVGHRQTRNRGTIGGSLAHADPAAELPAVCLAYDASLEIRGASGSRRTPMRDFVSGFMTTDIGSDELLCAIHIDPWPEGHGYSFQEFARRHGDFAVAGAAVLLNVAPGGRIDRAAIALCGVSHGPVRREQAEALLIGETIEDALVARVAAEASAIDPAEDIHGSASYRRHLVRTLTARALHEAWARTGVAARVAA